MLRKIAYTSLAKIVQAIISLIIIVINGKYLGSEGVGELALLILGITIVMMVNSFAGGTAIVYLAPKNNFTHIVIITYLFSIIASGLTVWILSVLSLIPSSFIIDIFVLGLLQSFANTNLQLLISKENIKAYNLLQIAQMLAIFILLLILFVLFKYYEVEAYIYCLYLGYSITWLFSWNFLYKYFKWGDLKLSLKLSKELFRFGTYVQFASIMQLMNYRLNYYILDAFYGKSLLGIFDMGVKLAEGMWLPAKSISLVQYSAISNTQDLEYARKTTIIFFKISFVIIIALLAFLMALPSGLFALIKPEFALVPTTIIYLSPGIIAIATTMMFSHYFSGIGKHYINTIGSGIGLVFTIAIGFWIIPIYGLTGAALTATSSYTSMLCFHFVFFLRTTKTPIKEFVINKQDIRIFIQLIKEKLKKR